VSFSVRIVDAGHRPDLFAEIEYDDELVAEAFVEDGRKRVSFVDLDGSHMWGAEAKDLEFAVAQARQELRKFGLLE
jgi:hypothetical protein